MHEDGNHIMASKDLNEQANTNVADINLSEHSIEDLLSVTLSEPIGQRIYAQTLAEQYHRLQTLADFRERLVEFTVRTLSQHTNKDFHQRLLDGAVAVIPGAQAGNLLVRDAAHNEYYYAAIINYNLELSVLKERLKVADLSLIYAESHPSVLHDVSSSYSMPHTERLLENNPPRAIQTSLTVPVLLGGHNVAYLTLDNFEQDDAFDNEAIAMAEAFAAQTAAVLKRLRLEVALRQKNKDAAEINRKLEQANHYKSDFLASMSHELRTPLTSIIGFGELLYEGTLGELSTLQRDALKDILDSGQHLLSLINDVLDLAKVEAGRMDLATEELDLNELIEESCRVMRERLERAQLELKTILPPEGALLRGDHRKIKQILLNLLSNAIKFTPEGGRITISVQGLHVSNSWRISVRDTGIGIAEEDKSKLFKEYSQLNTSSKSKGTGLGLAISQRFVELHGGHIEVRSKPNHGSTFSFTLPKIPKESSGQLRNMITSNHIRPQNFKERQPHILVAHSEHALRAEICKQLHNKINQEVIEVTSGQGIINWLGEYMPDLLITGLSLRDMSGLDVLEQTQGATPTLLLVPTEEDITRDIMDMYPNLWVEAREILLDEKQFQHLVKRILLETRELNHSKLETS